MSARRRELVPNKPIGECFLSGANSVSKQETANFEGGNLAWEASTLPLSYTRSVRIYSSPKDEACKGRGPASSDAALQYLFHQAYHHPAQPA